MIGYFGGTFDPVHLGHMHLADSLLERYHFNRFIFVPNQQNPLKTSKATAPGSLRVEMLRHAIHEKNDSRLEVLETEVLSPPPSYTIDTIEKLASSTPEEIALILGDEVFRELPQWKDPLKLMTLAHCIVVARNSIEPDLIRNTLIAIGAKNLLQISETRWSHHNGTRWIAAENVAALPYSATSLRREISEKWRTNHLSHPPQGIQRSVWLLIKEKQLYAVT